MTPCVTEKASRVLKSGGDLPVSRLGLLAWPTIVAKGSEEKRETDMCFQENGEQCLRANPAGGLGKELAGHGARRVVQARETNECHWTLALC